MLIMHISQTQMSLILLLSLVAFSCFKQVTFAQLQRLDPNEADVLRQIATTLGVTNPTNKDPCESDTISETASISAEQSITCDYRDGSRHVRTLKLQTMSLEGTLPPELVNLTFLKEIDLTRNYLSGGLPKEWAKMRHLNRISLTANHISGKIPKEWGNFANLTYLSLEANQLSGTIPKELGNLVNLTALSLSSNQFVGRLPITLANLTKLTDFRISDNSFNGTVPEFIGRWTKLKRLEMSSSGLEGPISPTIFALGDLTDLRITDMIGPKFDFPKLNNKPMEHLVLRNLNISGFIPTYIWDMAVEETLDLTFNKLEGEIKGINTNTDFIFLSGNMLSGTIPESIIHRTENNLDLSYNNFTSQANCPTSSNIKMYRSFSWEHNMSGLRPGPCPDRFGCQKYYQSFHINCGGPDVTINHTKYEGDGGANGAVLQYDSGTKWGFISAGDFMGDGNKNAKGYVVSADPDTQPKLYSEARASPLFLTYYGYCLKNGNYTVNLHFAEILFKDKEPYHKVGRRIFDIYIQGILKRRDFNIKEQADGTGKAIIETFNATVIENTLEIHLYWAGKGTTCIPSRGVYGPLISAISVCYGFRANCDAAAQLQRLSSVIAGVTVGTFALVVLVVSFCILRLRKKRNTDEGVEDYFDQLSGILTRFSYEELKRATEDFQRKLGEGGFGSVFEGTLVSGEKVAVKRLDALGQGKKEFLAEVKTIGSIHHVNLVRLVGFCTEKLHRLLVYEFMGNGSLDRWIFHRIPQKPALDWQTRKTIIIDIAKGLAYLHEECRQRIVHLDIKPQNILLDVNLRAKISDFGLSKLLDRDQSQVVTTMRGTPGYLAPELFSSIITEKADVYSFGIVVMEVVCGRKNLDRSHSEGCIHLLPFFMIKAEDDCLIDLVDKDSEDMQLHREEIAQMMRVAVWCLQNDYNRRPSMSTVVKVLEGTMEFEASLTAITREPEEQFGGATMSGAEQFGGATMSALLPSILSGPR